MEIYFVICLLILFGSFGGFFAGAFFIRGKQIEVFEEITQHLLAEKDYFRSGFVISNKENLDATELERKLLLNTKFVQKMNDRIYSNEQLFGTEPTPPPLPHQEEELLSPFAEFHRKMDERDAKLADPLKEEISNAIKGMAATNN